MLSKSPSPCRTPRSSPRTTGSAAGTGPCPSTAIRAVGPAGSGPLKDVAMRVEGSDGRRVAEATPAAEL
ncbi:Protein of unknown function [Micromonospora lupini str. Lupac 08]|uniref:Uncharacterized protein n=1 Tax=Micromonospora lupini str. Lupac 08 TaxID=1150864 RepID=I0LCT4_9ACTN|nr:Protein of unknown function [Micromonospora lupini str. Lupac 08]